MNEGSIKKVTNLVKPFLTNNERLDINIARMRHEFKGPICDNSGFNQHKGECWNDTLQEIFFFSDGLKDITQPLFYNLDTSTENLTALVSSKLFPDTDKLNDKEQNTVSKLVKYIRLTKIRFITHYNFLIDIITQNRPTLTKIYKSKRRYSTVCGIASAKHITNLYKGDSNVYNPGLIYTLKNELFNNLIRIFDIPYVVTALKSTNSLSNINGIFISSNSMILRDKNTYAFKGGHAFGFLKCDSKWKYYDDNERAGLIDVDESIVSLFINEEDVAISVDGDSNIHILKYKLHRGNNTNIKSRVVTITHYYDNNKWNDWADDANDFRKIYAKNTVSIVRPRIRWANIKRRTAKGGNKLRKTVKLIYNLKDR
jgi:hypothetical protein